MGKLIKLKIWQISNRSSPQENLLQKTLKNPKFKLHHFRPIFFWIRIKLMRLEHISMLILSIQMTSRENVCTCLQLSSQICKTPASINVLRTTTSHSFLSVKVNASETASLRPVISTQLLRPISRTPHSDTKTISPKRSEPNREDHLQIFHLCICS